MRFGNNIIWKGENIMSEDFKEVQDMLEQAKELVKTLKNKYNELSKPKNVRWRAEKGGDFYIVSGCSKYGNVAYKMTEDFETDFMQSGVSRQII